MDQIVLTADMIRAGAAVFENWNLSDDPYAETLVRQIFHAMVALEWTVQDDSVHEFGHIYDISRKIAAGEDLLQVSRQGLDLETFLAQGGNLQDCISGPDYSNARAGTTKRLRIVKD